MVFPPVHPFSGIEGAVEDLGDLQFVQDRIKAVEWFQVSGAIDAINDTIEYVPANGKTAVLFEAKIVLSTNSQVFSQANTGTFTRNDQIVANLKVDGVVKDKTGIGTSSSTSMSASAGRGNGAGFGNKGDGKFHALGISLAGNGTKKIEIENVLDDGSAFATMSGWLFTT